MMKDKLYRLTLSLLFLLSINAWTNAQVHHYETIVYEDDIWSYKIANSEPPSNWMQSSFNDASWSTGQGGFGYGDGDDNTFIPIGNGVYIRTDFQIVNLSSIERLFLDADYDDAFVAYLNGVEVARANIGTVGIPPAYDDAPNNYSEAVLYDGEIPPRFILDDHINLLVQGTNTLAVHVLNYNATSSDLSGRFFLSAGINNPSVFYGNTPWWFEEPIDFFSSNLPIIKINTNGQQIYDEPDITAQMGIVFNGTGNLNYVSDPSNHYDGQISIEIRGASSQNFEKKGYRIETQDALGENNNVSLLGMPSENDWVLHGPYSDKSLIRNVLSYHLGRLTGRYAPRAELCELMINDEYRGVYVLVEKIKRDGDRVDIAKVTELDVSGDELTGGYLMQIDRDAGVNDGWYSYTGDYPYYYVVEDPKLEDILPVQRSYIEDYMHDFEDAMTGNNYVNLYQNYLDIGSFVDYFLVNEIGKHIDAFKLSFYMHKKKDSNGGKLHMGPIWDFNLAYGNFDFDCDPSPNGWIFQCTSPAQWLDNTVQIPAVRDSLKCRWVELRETVYATENIMSFIDSLVVELQAPSTRNFTKFEVLGEYLWPNDYVGQTYMDEVNFLKNFIQLRMSWMDNNMFGNINNCQVSTSNNNLITDINFELFPNPVVNNFQVKYSSEEIKNAVFSIYTVDGKLIEKEKINSDEALNINTEKWNTGMYIYNVHLDGKVLSVGSLVKE